MRSKSYHPLLLSRTALPFLIAFFCVHSYAQSTPAPTPDQGDVVRVNTELVQTDVMVFDKQGHFVDNLKRENFELRIDGRPRSIQFFERIRAGRDEEAQLAAARGESAGNGTSRSAVVPLDRGRSVFFFIDDLHLGLSSVVAARQLITRFFTDEMGQNDEAAIVAASGQIGFLDQLTDNKVVLRSAIERLKPRPYSVKDMERPTMTEYQALLVDGYDRDVSDYFVDETMRQNPGITRDSATNMVRNRARTILDQAALYTRNTFSGLEGFIRAVATQPGRKLIFFISDGFFLDFRNTDFSQRLQQITSLAARSGVVIYSVDARGLVASTVDPSDPPTFDPSGRLQRSTTGELFASQDGLNALARDTGGKPVFNTNDLRAGVVQALKETAVYYLLAWQPSSDGPAVKFRKLEVSVPGRNDLTVRVRRGFFDLDPSGAAAKKAPPKKATANPPDAELAGALRAPFPERRLPISLSVNYLNTQTKGAMLSASMQVPTELLTFAAEADKKQAFVDLMGGVYDSQGHLGATFSEHITVDEQTTLSTTDKRKDLIFTYPVTVAPGLYQVRVAARDRRSGLTGTTNAWIQIPDLSKGEFCLSSLIVGERTGTSTTPASTEDNATYAPSLSVDHQFRNSSFLRFLIFAYNAAGGTAPDLAAQVQVVRDNQPVLTTALRKIQGDGASPTSVPYAADIPLMDLPAGRYVLQLTIIDRIAKKSAIQQTRFEVY